jgi:hypothetical protein
MRKSKQKLNGYVYPEDWVHVGWWFWFDGDLSKSGIFQYDHSLKGISIPVFRPVNKE